MYSREIANFPGSNLEPYRESGKRLEQLSIDLCDKLRSSDISFYDAYYRFEMEVEITYNQMGKEYGAWFLNNFDDIINLFKIGQ